MSEDHILSIPKNPILNWSNGDHGSEIMFDYFSTNMDIVQGIEVCLNKFGRWVQPGYPDSTAVFRLIASTVTEFPRQWI